MGAHGRPWGLRVCHLSCCHWRIFGCPSPWGPSPVCSRSGPLQQHSPQNMGGAGAHVRAAWGSAPAKAQTCRDATAAVVSRARVGSAGETCPQPSLASEGTHRPQQLCLLRPQPPPPAPPAGLSAGAVSRVCSKSIQQEELSHLQVAPVPPHRLANPSRRTSTSAPGALDTEQEYSLRSPGGGWRLLGSLLLLWQCHCGVSLMGAPGGTPSPSSHAVAPSQNPGDAWKSFQVHRPPFPL